MKQKYILKVLPPSVLAILAILAILVGCNRSKSTDKKKFYPDSLNGAWELREVQGGMIAGASPYYSPENGHIWEFEDSGFKHLVAGQIADSGILVFDRDTCPATQSVLDAFTIPNNDGYQIFFEISKDTLTLYNGVIAADGTIEKYVRIK